MKEIDNRWTVVGIVSFGDEECTGAGGVYTRVDYYYDWIMSHSSATKTTTQITTTKTLPPDSGSNTSFSFKLFNILLIAFLLA
jgi:secreted trypsin-like serine protease